MLKKVEFWLKQISCMFNDFSQLLKTGIVCIVAVQKYKCIVILVHIITPFSVHTCSRPFVQCKIQKIFKRMPIHRHVFAFPDIQLLCLHVVKLYVMLGAVSQVYKYCELEPRMSNDFERKNYMNIILYIYLYML